MKRIIFQWMLSLSKFFDTFKVPISRKVPKTKIQKDKVRGKEGIQRESTLTRKGKDIYSVQSKSKKGCFIPYQRTLMGIAQSL